MLDIGDVIELNQSIEESVIDKSRRNPEIYWTTGKVNKKLAIQVLDTLEGGRGR